MADDPQLEEEESNSKVVVINECYCTPDIQKFIVKKKLTKYQTNATFEVFDVEQNLLLQAHGSNVQLHRTFLIKDPHDSPIVTLHEAVITSFLHLVFSEVPFFSISFSSINDTKLNFSMLYPCVGCS